MKTYPRSIARPVRHVRVPAFVPVPLRGRADGWTPLRQAAFLAALARTRSVCAAARKPGAESFAAVWDAVLGRAIERRRKVTGHAAASRAGFCLMKPVIYGGEHVATVWKPDNAALLRHIAQLDRADLLVGAARGKSQDFAGGSASTSEQRRR
jgi:hypothetical protein